MTESYELVRYEAARYALQTAVRVDEVKDIRDKAAAMAAYAKQANDTELISLASEIKIRAERRAGELLREMPKARGGNPNLPTGSRVRPVESALTLADLGISKDQSSRWQKLAAVPEDKFEEAVSAALEVAGEVSASVFTQIHNHRAQGSGENEWYTPAEYIERARRVLGTIDLDPASSEIAQRTVRAARFYTIDDDGLNKPWKGKVWLNPPYAQPAIQLFVETMCAAVKIGVSSAIMLTHNYTDTKWFHLAATNSSAICFTRGRIGFLDVDGRAAAPTQGQAFFYFGPDVAKFCEVFSDVGFIVVPERRANAI